MISCAFFLLHSHVSSCDFTCLRGILVSKLFARVVNTCERGTKSCESDPEETLLYSKVISHSMIPIHKRMPPESSSSSPNQRRHPFLHRNENSLNVLIRCKLQKLMTIYFKSCGLATNALDTGSLIRIIRPCHYQNGFDCRAVFHKLRMQCWRYRAFQTKDTLKCLRPWLSVPNSQTWILHWCTQIWFWQNDSAVFAHPTSTWFQSTESFLECCNKILASTLRGIVPRTIPHSLKHISLIFWRGWHGVARSIVV